MRKLTQTEWLGVVASIFVVAIVFYLFTPFHFFTKKSMTSSEGEAVTNIVSNIVTDLGLSIKDVVRGEGKEAVNGQVVVVHYIGRLTDGTQFDSSVDRGQPFTFVLGRGEVIKGWDEGFAGMRVGGKRILTIPPELGYGANAVGSIDRKSTLVFEVTLLDVVDPSTLQQ